MKKLDLLNLANKGYPDGFLSEHFDEETGDYLGEQSGDMLAQAIVAELTDTFDPDATDQEQVDTACHYLANYCRDIEAVQDALAQWVPSYAPYDGSIPVSDAQATSPQAP